MSPQMQELDRLAAARRADLRELCLEFQSAVSALTLDDLEALKRSVERQEHLATRLQNLFEQGEFGDRRTGIPQEVVDLIHVTRVYSALLQRSMRTAALRAALCRTYKQHFPKPSDAPSESKWSCEV